MSKLSAAYDGDELEWLHAHSRDFPLLSAQEERVIDEKKWQTRDTLVELLVSDAGGRAFLTLWVENFFRQGTLLRVAA